MNEAAHTDIRVEEQYADAAQQHDARTMGMWLFLLTETMLFGALIIGSLVYRHLYNAEWIAASLRLHLWLGTLNTVILLTSSLTMAFAVDFARRGKAALFHRFAIATAALGVAFLTVKGFEYYLEARDGLVPIVQFHAGQALKDGPGKLFMDFYFASTLLHAVHLIIAVVLLLALSAWIRLRGLTANRAATVETMGLFWHLVDCVWIFLFPLLYLVR